MRLQESGEMYLETIFVLTKEKPTVRAIEVGEHMGYSKPSVSRAMGILRQGGLIRIDADGGISLTEEGRAVAAKTYERHTVLKDLLIRLGVNADTASKDACRIEHHISDESFEAIKQYIISL